MYIIPSKQSDVIVVFNSSNQIWNQTNTGKKTNNLDNLSLTVSFSLYQFCEYQFITTILHHIFIEY